jgi:anti-sigma regulatory factor (Ser/Thr protein kinase)
VNILHLDLPAEPASIARARDALGTLEPQSGPEMLPDLRLLVSEVVTNAVRHAATNPGARVRVVAENGADCVRVEIHDEGPGFVAAAAPGPRSGAPRDGGSSWCRGWRAAGGPSPVPTHMSGSSSA